MKSHSIKFEISILHTAILGVILAVFSFVLYIISNSFFQQIDQQLKVKAQAVDSAIKSYVNSLGEDPDALPKAVQKTMAMKSEGFFSIGPKKISEDWVKQSQALTLNKDYINFFSRDGKNVISSSNLDKNLKTIFLEDTHSNQSRRITFKTINYNHKQIRVITYPLGGKASGEYFIQVGVSQDPIMQQLRNWLYSVVISLPLILLLTSLMGRMQANRILEPVHEITQMANKITHQDLSARIKAKHFDTEMESLIESFNEMIARLEKSFKHIEEFSHHVAHELKTPLTIIKGEADLLLRKERSQHEYQQALRIVLEESERVLKTIEDLLLLTKIDYQPEVFKFEEFDFMDFFSEICEQSRMLAADKAIGIIMRPQEAKSPPKIKADKVHLRRLFFNIIDNAIKYTPEGGRIDIKTATHQNKIIVSIIDTGPGIAQENLAKIFEKFFRSDHNTTGTGLGLNIAYSIAKLHKGEIRVESQLKRGTTFKIILPLA